MKRARVLVALAVSVALAGCGQKGALYLPSQKKSKVPATSPSAPPQSTAPVSAPGETAPTQSAPAPQAVPPLT